MRPLISLLLISFNYVIVAKAETNCSTLTQSSISVGFNYENSGITPLRNTISDTFFNFTRSVNVQGSRNGVKYVNDADVRTKEIFLKNLKRETKNSDIVQFNYAGHSGIMPNGEWAMLLPTAPSDITKMCLEELAERGFITRGAKKVNDNPPKKPKGKECFGKQDALMMPYMVSSSDLKKTFKGKKIFAVLDSCQSGAADFGKNSVILAASRRNEIAADGINHGSLTTDFIEKHQSCSVDTDGNGTITAAEMVRQFMSINKKDEFEGTSEERLERAGRKDLTLTLNTDEITQHPAVLNDFNKPWLDCINISKPNCPSATQYPSDRVDQ